MVLFNNFNFPSVLQTLDWGLIDKMNGAYQTQISFHNSSSCLRQPKQVHFSATIAFSSIQAEPRPHMAKVDVNSKNYFAFSAFRCPKG